ncbi:MAG: hypothetical protein R3301_02150 [Saprospiraceae bacterium]|nr:hypothetical protein [Saprospiraceae bacterium]
MKRNMGLLLIVLGLAAGIYGFTKLQDSGGGVQIGELEISAQDTGTRNQAYILLGGGALALILGVTLMSRSRS